MEEIKAEGTKSLEESMKELDGIIAGMEKSGISLEESFELYKKGVSELKHCSEMVDRIEKELIVLEEGEDGGI